MELEGIIVLCVYILTNISSLIAFNVTDKEASKKDRIKVNILLSFGGLIYWIVMLFNSIRYLLMNKK